MRTKLSFFLFFVFTVCNACECPPINPVSKELTDKYDVIFYGTVDSIIPCGNSGIGTAWFTIKNLYKGSLEKRISIDYDCTSACMMSFFKNEEWIIYASYQRVDLLTVDLCSHSRKKSDAGAADFYQVSSGRSFEEENGFLKNSLGLKSLIAHNDSNKKQNELQPRNEQPTAVNKLWLLIISVSTMLVVYFFSKKKFKNDR
jgi:hypothetical protein